MRMSAWVTSSNELQSEFMHSGAERKTRGCAGSRTCGNKKLGNKKLNAATMRLSMRADEYLLMI